MKILWRSHGKCWHGLDELTRIRYKIRNRRRHFQFFLYNFFKKWKDVSTLRNYSHRERGPLNPILISRTQWFDITDPGSDWKRWLKYWKNPSNWNQYSHWNIENNPSNGQTETNTYILDDRRLPWLPMSEHLLFWNVSLTKILQEYSSHFLCL